MLAGSAIFFEIYISTVPKHVLKHSGTFFGIMHATLDSQLVKVNKYVSTILQYVANDSEMLFNELEIACLGL